MRSYVYYSMLSMSGAYGMNHYGIDVSEGLEMETTLKAAPIEPIEEKKAKKPKKLKKYAVPFYILTSLFRGR